jgi:predicted nucleic acid-binding protein
MRYLLDANVWVALLRRSSSLVVARFQAAAPSADLCICFVVVAELWHGCARSAKPITNRMAVDALIARFPNLPYTDLAARKPVSRPVVETQDVPFWAPLVDVVEFVPGLNLSRFEEES